MKPLAVLALSLSSLACSVAASDRNTLVFSIDNDGMVRTDHDYSNGLFLSYTTGAINPPMFLRPLSLSAWGVSSLDKFEFVLGHKMWTPEDIEEENAIAGDRPYAGFFHTEFNYISLHPQQAHRFNLTVGVTGDNSFASEAQSIVHSIVGSDDPMGWDNQIDEGWVGSIGYLSHYNLMRERSFGNSQVEISNVSEVNAGNFRSDISTGFMFRWGTDLEGNMGSANIDHENPFRAGMIGASNSGWFGFAGAKGRIRFNDVTIEGHRELVNPDPNLPLSAYEMEIEPLQASMIVGMVWYNQNFGASLSVSGHTPEYKDAPQPVYGTGGFTLFGFF
ncbi:lipid A deacylase LpxR family protein [Vibrio agarivorans]|uniref:lipid A deacylase LpxR family protein n=1 Tax=Vibrio agarivorans TaxID=153622 RepID=UPI0022306A47|nr:lipid A deacylase LpxR family protein [Vibrio agarivorans]